LLHEHASAGGQRALQQAQRMSLLLQSALMVIRHRRVDEFAYGRCGGKTGL
jgi:hypothetical protein